MEKFKNPEISDEPVSGGGAGAATTIVWYWGAGGARGAAGTVAGAPRVLTSSYIASSGAVGVGVPRSCQKVYR